MTQIISAADARALLVRFPKASTFQRNQWAAAAAGMPSEAVREPQRPCVRQDAADFGMNKTELAFHAHLQATRPNAKLYAQAITIRLGNGVRYRPDFVTVEEVTVPGLPEPVRHVTAFEVKGGHVRDDAKIKAKLAPEAYPWISFYIVTRARDGGWEFLRLRAGGQK